MAIKWAVTESGRSIPVIEEEVSVATMDGNANAYFTHPEGHERLPAVILYMDALGIRAALREMAKRLAQAGYYVLLPNLFYRWGRCENFDMKKDADQYMKLLNSLSVSMAMADSEAYLSYLSGRREVAPTRLGVVGYCMGGRMALAAAGYFGDRLKAAAIIHGGSVATDAKDSPHRLAPQVRAELYIGVAGIDPFLQKGEMERLQAALDAAEVKYSLETYPNVKHGFAVPGLSVYDQPASEKHWERVTALFARAL